jgi:hypothetical protein
VVPLRQCLTLPHRVFLARVVADATDYFPTHDSEVPAQGQSPSKLLAAHLHGAGIVRIVNAIGLLSMSEQAPVGDSVPRVSVRIAGDDLPAMPGAGVSQTDSWEADPRIRIADV